MAHHNEGSLRHEESEYQQIRPLKQYDDAGYRSLTRTFGKRDQGVGSSTAAATHTRTLSAGPALQRIYERRPFSAKEFSQAIRKAYDAVDRAYNDIRMQILLSCICFLFALALSSNTSFCFLLQIFKFYLHFMCGLDPRSWDSRAGIF